MEKIITGKVGAYLSKERLLLVISPRARTFVHLTHRQADSFGRYLVSGAWVALIGSREKPFLGYPVYGADHFMKITRRISGCLVNCFDQEEVRSTEEAILSRPENRLFIDMEFTMPFPGSRKPFEAEIIEFGCILTNVNGKEILREKLLVHPRDDRSLNRITMRFVRLKPEDFKNALTYAEFHERFSSLIARYQPRIIHWGRNDALALEASCLMNNLPPFKIRRHLINLMSIMKIYYHEKKDLGLFTTYEKFTGLTLPPQEHDSLEDARILLEVFRAFKASVARHETKLPGE